MDLHSLTKTTGSSTGRKRLGRGRASGTGKTSGKGHKGQMARKGHKRKIGFEGGQMPLIRRIPKRGFKNPNRKVLLPVNVAALDKLPEGSEITPETIRGLGLAKGPCDGIKILGHGEVTRKLTVIAHAISASARSKIESAGGTCELVKA